MVLASPAPPQPNPQLATGEKRVLLQGLNWQSYQQILQALPQSRAARLTYDRGTLEITVPLENHEFFLRLIERFIVVLVEELGMDMKTMGSTTLTYENLERGSEPDCAYYIQNRDSVAGREVDFEKDPAPDLVVEVDITHTDIDKNRLYAAMEIPELWRYNGQEWLIFQLRDGSYQGCDRSPTFELVEKDDLYRFLAEAKDSEMQAQSNLRSHIREKIQNKTQQ